MIYAIGHDIVENTRIARMLEDYEQKFIDKVLSTSEQIIYRQRNDKVKYLAKRFAAKEAFAKACGTGLRSPILMPNISIVNNELGKPAFDFDISIKEWLMNKKIAYSHLSLSDETSISSAFVILETK